MISTLGRAGSALWANGACVSAITTPHAMVNVLAKEKFAFICRSTVNWNHRKAVNLQLSWPAWDDCRLFPTFRKRSVKSRGRPGGLTQVHVGCSQYSERDLAGL